MRRRMLCLLAALVLGVGLKPSPAQSAVREDHPRIVVVRSRDNAFYNPAVKGFLSGLRQRGIILNEKTDVSSCALTGKQDFDTRMVQDLLQKRASLILSLGTDATRLVASLKPSAPVLFGMVIDPIGLGVVKSLESPGGSISGTTLMVSPGKQVEALLQAVPRVKRLGVLYTDHDPTSLAFLKLAAEEARTQGVEIEPTPVAAGQNTAQALAKLAAAADAIWLIPDPASSGPDAFRDTLEFANARHFPILGSSAPTVRGGALLALSAAGEDLGDITADMAVHVLDGSESIANMRVRGPRRTLLSINLLAAKALGIKIPGAILQLADEVIDTQKDDN